jgi:acetyl esterase/lipase
MGPPHRLVRDNLATASPPLPKATAGGKNLPASRKMFSTSSRAPELSSRAPPPPFRPSIVHYAETFSDGPGFCAQVLLAQPSHGLRLLHPLLRGLCTRTNLDRPTVEWFWSLYRPDPAQRFEPLVSPLRVSPSQLRGLPPALIIVAGCDPVRDEGAAYARKLAAAGVPVTAFRYQGAVRGFTMITTHSPIPLRRSAARC